MAEITFIIPTIGRPTLQRAINSLIAQTNKNWKCVVVFDGVDIVNYADDRIKCIKIEKTGSIGQYHGMSGLVRNHGLRIADTEWIGFLDDDDTIHQDYVERLFNKYSDKDLVIWRMAFESGHVVPGFGNEALIHGNIGISFCYKNKFDDVLFDENKDGEDLALVRKIVERSRNYIVTSEVYYKVNH
jgi:glycosyltransferase involved in cell wall biosynthesis